MTEESTERGRGNSPLNLSQDGDGGGRDAAAKFTLSQRRAGRAVGEDLRRRAVAAVVEKGMSARAAGRLYDVDGHSVARWVRRFRERGHVRADRQGGHRVSPVEAHRERIFRLLEERPDLTGAGLRDALAAEGIVFEVRSVYRFLKRHGLQRGRRLARLRRSPGAKAAAAPGG